MATLTVWNGTECLNAEFQPPQHLDQLLNQIGCLSEHPCGGNGTCGKCKISVRGHISGSLSNGCEIEEVLRCQTVLLGDADVWIPKNRILANTEESRISADRDVASLGAAVDIGTTTIAVKLIDLDTGNCLSECATENPQRVIAADVMGRIQAALTGSDQLLQQEVLSGLEKLLADACGSMHCRMEDIRRMTLVGNTTMLYLLLGKSPKTLATAPFRADDLFGRNETILNRAVWIPPCMDAFVGADMTAAVLASEMCRNDKVALLCDIGTNGEIGLWKEGKLYVTATAAGPALEGAEITCGCCSVPGAIDKVWLEDGIIRFHTIAEMPATGICGSGLMDAIAVFLETGDIDETGAMEEDQLTISDKVALYPKDIRNVQLAKAAIAAGIETLLQQSNTSADEVKCLYIAGNFGSHLNMTSAVRIGLVPEKLRDRVVILGNAALTGAAMTLRDSNMQIESRRIANCAVSINLGGNPIFNEYFIENILFSF